MNTVWKKQVALVMVAGLVLLVCWIGWQGQQAKADLTSQATTVAKMHNQLAALSSGGQEIILPEDGGSLFVSVFVHKNWRERPREARILRWFARVPSLVRIRLRTIWHLYTPEDHTFKQSYSEVTLPTVMVQEPDGKVLYKSTEKNIPATAVALTRELESVVGNDDPRLFNRRPWLRLRPWKRPRPSPDPEPGPEPLPDDELDADPDSMPDMSMIPDIQPDDADSGGGGFWVLLGIVTLCTAVGAAVFNFRREAGL